MLTMQCFTSSLACNLCFHLCILTEAQLRLVEIFTQLFFKTIYCIIFGTLCLTTKKKLHLYLQEKEAGLLLEKKILGPLKITKSWACLKQLSKKYILRNEGLQVLQTCDTVEKFQRYLNCSTFFCIS